MIDLKAELARVDAAFPIVTPACDFDKTDRAWREMQAENAAEAICNDYEENGARHG